MKVVTSPVAQWPGTVTLASPMSLPQVVAWGEAVAAAASVRDGQGEPGGELKVYEAAYRPKVMLAILPGLLACVEKWSLAGFPERIERPEDYPFTPLEAAGELAAWLIGQVNLVINEETTVPKA